jgi:hypothetical protein
MAAPKQIKDYVGLVLQLPHTYWGADVAKQFYPNDWKSGSQEVKLERYVPATKSDAESLEFTADDGDTYKIVLVSLKTYWAQKRFQGSPIYISVCLWLCFVVTLSVSVLFVWCILCSAKGTRPRHQHVGKGQRKAKQASRRYQNVVLVHI